MSKLKKTLVRAKAGVKLERIEHLAARQRGEAFFKLTPHRNMRAVRAMLAAAAGVLCISGVDFPQDSSTAAFLPVTQRQGIPSHGYRSGDIELSTPTACGSGREWGIINNSIHEQSALVCTHEYIPGGRSGYSYRRSFNLVRLSPKQSQRLGCVIDHPQNYVELAWSEVGSPSKPELLIPYQALVIVNNANGTRVLYNRHIKKEVHVWIDRGSRFQKPGERYANFYLKPGDANLLGGPDGGVLKAEYANGYLNGANVPCSTPPDPSPSPR